MLVVSNISKRFRGAESPILENITFTTNGGERVGLIGPNGCGKSTLLDVIVGDTPVDNGGIQFTPPNLRVGYLRQGLVAPDETPLQDVLFPKAGAIAAAEAEVAQLADALGTANESEMDSLMAAYDAVLERLERLGYGVDVSAGERMLTRLGLGDVVMDMPVGTLSGGQKTRLNLAAILLDEPQLLLLDEPTNHLDISALEWLETWLNGFPGGALIVSHDRTFLDRVVNRIVAIDPETHRARVFVGNYSEYTGTLRHEHDKQRAQWKDQQVEIARLQTDMRQTMAKAVRKENVTKDSTQRRYAKKVAKRSKAKEKRLERYLESEERVEKPALTWGLKLDFGELPRAYRDVVTLEDLCIGYDKPLLSGLDLTIQDGERIAVMGPNGHGKSTLLKTITGEVPLLAGRVRLGGSVKVGYLAQEQEILAPNSNPLETLRNEVSMSETDARSFLHFFLFTGDEVFRPIAQLSYGERARLMLALLVARGSNLLVMDEPLNHLDLPARERFEQALSSFPGSVLAVVHDRYFVERFATTVWHIEDGTLTREVKRTGID